MYLASNIVVAIIAFVHIYILILEMFLWEKPAGLRAFGQTAQNARTTKVLAANQGLYNGFLAAGLGYSLIASDSEVAFTMKVFFLACVIVAGLYGGMTASRRIIFIQALPAVLALIAVLVL